MSRPQYTFFKTIRGVECIIQCYSFENSPDCNYVQFDEICISDLETEKPFDITEKEYEEISIEATENYLSDSGYDYF